MDTLKAFYGLDKPIQISGTLLGFDYGSRKMGIAVGQTVTNSARPLKPMKMCDGSPNWNQLDKLIAKWKPDGLVIGIPVNHEYDDQRMRIAAEKFGAALQERYQRRVFGVDEHLTTFAARQILNEDNNYYTSTQKSVDSLAAMIILESWLRQYGC